MENKKYTTLQLVLRLLSFMKHLLPRIVLAIAFAVGGFLTMILIPASLVFLLSPKLHWNFYGLFYHQFLMFPGLLKVIVLFTVLSVARGLFRYGEHYFGHYVAFHSLAYLRKHIFAKLIALAPAKLDGQKGGRLFKMIGDDVEALEIFFAHTLAPIGTAIVSASIMFVFFSRYSLVLAFMAMLTYGLLAWCIPVVYAKKIEALLDEQNQEKKKYSDFFLESLSAMEDLLQFQKTEERFAELSKKSEDIYQGEQKIAALQHTQMSRSFLILGLSFGCFALYLFHLLQTEQLLLAQALLLFVVFMSSFSPFLELSRLPLGFKKAMKAAQNFFDLMDEEVYEDKGLKTLEDWEKVEVKAVSFAYPKREVKIFEGLDVAFPKDKIIGIKGPSGSGKSTLLKLLMRWYPVTEGEILLGNEELAQFSRESVKSKIAYVPQYPTLFKQTLRENLSFGKDISDEAIWEVAQRCGMKARLESLEQGLDTLVAEAEFSSGEAQRLELIRALLKNAPVLILDEPTSHLDSLNEAGFLNIVKEEYQGTVFIISHRASTLAFADLCYALDTEKKQFVLEWEK